MAVDENKTKPTGVPVNDFIAGLPNETSRTDAETLCRILGRITGDKPVMWGPSIIGYGQYHYQYASGREGDTGLIGFSPRATNLVIYLIDGFDNYQDLLARLGPHQTSKACLYIKRLSDIDLSVLEAILEASYRRVTAPDFGSNFGR